MAGERQLLHDRTKPAGERRINPAPQSDNGGDGRCVCQRYPTFTQLAPSLAYTGQPSGNNLGTAAIEYDNTALLRNCPEPNRICRSVKLDANRLARVNGGAKPGKQGF